MAKNYVNIKYLTLDQLKKLNDKRLVEVLKTARKHASILDAGEFEIELVETANKYYDTVKALSTERANVE